MLRFIISDTINFENSNIPIDNERKSLDGSKTLKHIEHLTDEQFNVVRFDSNFNFMSDDDVYNLMQTLEWKDNEV
jgi:hypothetical protein